MTKLLGRKEAKKRLLAFSGKTMKKKKKEEEEAQIKEELEEEEDWDGHLPQHVHHSTEQTGSKPGVYSRVLGIQKCFALSPHLISKAAEMISEVFKNVSTVNKVEILSLCL